MREEPSPMPLTVKGQARQQPLDGLLRRLPTAAVAATVSALSILIVTNAMLEKAAKAMSQILI